MPDNVNAETPPDTAPSTLSELTRALDPALGVSHSVARALELGPASASERALAASIEASYSMGPIGPIPHNYPIGSSRGNTLTINSNNDAFGPLTIRSSEPALAGAAASGYVVPNPNQGIAWSSGSWSYNVRTYEEAVRLSQQARTSMEARHYPNTGFVVGDAGTAFFTPTPSATSRQDKLSELLSLSKKLSADIVKLHTQQMQILQAIQAVAAEQPLPEENTRRVDV